MRGRMLVLALAAAAVAIAYTARGARDDRPGARAAAGPPPIHIAFAYSTEKTALMKLLVDRFNARRTIVGGRRVVIDGQPIASGEAERRIADKRLKPVAWSPASSLWAGLLNYDADQTWAPRASPSLMRTPLVIAMWTPMAEALGWPTKRIGFADLLRLSRSGAGWAAYGRPEFGPFRLVHTNPDFSTSGLSAVAAEYFTASGKTKGLTTRDVTSSRARSAVRALEHSIVHYGDTTPFVAQRMREEGTSYASAVVMEETTLLDFNRRRRPRQARLVALYPPEGTFFSDNPMIVLDAPWVTPEQARAAVAFREYLTTALTPALAGRYFFRPAGGGTPGPEIAKANGADPLEPRHVLTPPAPPVLAAIRSAWRRDRKPANIMLVVDTSQSMSEEGRIEHAQAGLQAFLRGVQPQDSVGLLTFSTESRLLAPVGPAKRQLPILRRMVRGLTTGGGTAMYDATIRAFDRVEALPHTAGHINAVVVLTDGDDTISRTTQDELIAVLDRHAEDTERVRVYTIAYAPGGARFAAVLARIAAAGGGSFNTGTTANIESIYTNISSFF